MQSKALQLCVLVLFISLIILNACSFDEKRQEAVTQKLEPMLVDQNTENHSIGSINSLVGLWEYSELRISVMESGTPPIRKILLGIT